MFSALSFLFVRLCYHLLCAPVRLFVCLPLFSLLYPFFTKQKLDIIENVKHDGQFKISFSNFDAALHIFFALFLTVIDKLNSDDILKIKFSRYSSFFNGRCCRCSLNCPSLLGRRASVCIFGYLFGCMFGLHSVFSSFLCCPFSCYC